MRYIPPDYRTGFHEKLRPAERSLRAWRQLLSLPEKQYHGTNHYFTTYPNLLLLTLPSLTLNLHNTP